MLTPAAYRGVDADEGDGVLVGDSAESFAAQVCGLLANPHAGTSESPATHTVSAVHTRSLVAVGGVDSYSVPAHTVNAVHTRSVVAVGATGTEPSDELMYQPVRCCPVIDPFGAEIMIYASRS